MKVKKFKHPSHFLLHARINRGISQIFHKRIMFLNWQLENPNNTFFSQFEKKITNWLNLTRGKKKPLLPRQQSLQLFLVLLSVNLCWVGMRFNTKLLTSIIWDIFQGQRFIEVDLDKITLDFKSHHLDSFKLKFVLSHSQVKRHEKVWPKLTTL